MFSVFLELEHRHSSAHFHLQPYRGYVLRLLYYRALAGPGQAPGKGKFIDNGKTLRFQG
jgi:hypothetical protein